MRRINLVRVKHAHEAFDNIAMLEALVRRPVVLAWALVATSPVVFALRPIGATACHSKAWARCPEQKNRCSSVDQGKL